MSQSLTSWGSRLGFILASAGSAVGLGAIWKFPYMSGANGGAAFMIPYIVFTLTCGVAMLLSEYVVGRAGRAGAIRSLTNVAGRGWGFFGAVGMLTAFFILCFYSCVGGWCLKYLVDAILGLGLTKDAAELNANFGAFVSNGPESYAYQLVFLLINLCIVLAGVNKGLERLSKVLMPTLLILMLILIVRGLTLPGAAAGLEYLFLPRWDLVSAQSIFNAMGFAFFSLSLGAGVMVTYAGYLSEKTNLLTSTAWVAGLSIMAALLGGLMVMPTVFAFELDPNAGPGLTFVTMPAIFSQLPGGRFFAVIFYACLVFAAITSSVSMLEAVVGTMAHVTRWSRRTTAVGGTIAAMVIGFFCCMSFGSMADVKLFGKTVFDFLDYITSNIGMPIAALGFTAVAAWVTWKSTEKQLQTVKTVSPTVLKVIRLFIGVLAPVMIIVVVVTGL